MPHLTLEIKLVAAVSGFRKGTLVNVSLSVLGVTAPRSADQEPVGDSMSSSRKQRRGERDGLVQNWRDATNSILQCLLGFNRKVLQHADFN